MKKILHSLGRHKIGQAIKHCHVFVFSVCKQKLVTANILIHAPECGKCILRDPNFQNFPGGACPRTPLEARTLRAR